MRLTKTNEREEGESIELYERANKTDNRESRKEEEIKKKKRETVYPRRVKRTRRARMDM